MTVEKRILISVPGRFHGFNLAEELSKKPDISVTLHTSYPKWIVRRFINVSDINLISCSYAEYFFRVGKKIFKTNYLIRNFYHWLFKKSQLRALKSQPFDVFIGFAGVSYTSIVYCRGQGILSFVERGSTHIKKQALLLDLASEYSKEKIKIEVNEAELKEYSEADYIVTPTDFTYQSFVEYGISPIKIIKIPYGVNIKTFNPDRFSAPTKPVFCFAGSGSTRKGFPLLLDVMEELENSEAILHHYGGVSEYCWKYLRKRKRPNVKRFGNLPQTDLPEAYSNASCMVLPTYEEGMAMVLIQAFRMGLHIITTENSGCRDLMDINPSQFTIVDPGERNALKQAMLKHLLSYEFAKTMDDTKRNIIETQFSWEAYGNRYYEAIKLKT